MLDSFLDVVNQVWNDGLYGIGITELIISIVILFTGIIIRGVFIARVFKYLNTRAMKTPRIMIPVNRITIEIISSVMPIP